MRASLRDVALKARPAGVAVRRYVEGMGFMCPPVLQEAEIDGVPTMVALMHGADGTAQSYHLTNLETHESRVMQPLDTIEGGAIRLYPAADVMCVAIGVESALYATANLRHPAWAVVGAGGLEAFCPPGECKRLVILAEPDADYSSQAAAYSLAKRLTASGIDCAVSIPNGAWML